MSMKIVATDIKRQLDELNQRVAQLEIELQSERERNSTLYDALKSHQVVTDELRVFLDDAHGRRRLKRLLHPDGLTGALFSSARRLSFYLKI